VRGGGKWKGSLLVASFALVAMADPAEETVAAPPPTPAAPAESASDPPLRSPADAASPEKVSPPAPASAPETRSRGFRLLGEDTSVHMALGGGKSTEFFSSSFPQFFLVYATI
jgi:hypothetical protein